MERILLAIAISLTALSVNAQATDGYYVGKNFVSYNDSLMNEADAASFVTLGHGYAKDKRHVYLEGKVLEYADPTTFSLTDKASAEQSPTLSSLPKDNGDDDSKAQEDSKPSVLDLILGTDEGTNHYSTTNGKVCYNGKEMKKADAATFKYIGGEYGADKHHAYYKGKILGDAWGIGQIKYQGNGYATDGVHWYCNGKTVDRD